MSEFSKKLKAVVPDSASTRFRRARRWKQNLVVRLFRTRYENPNYERWDGPVVFLLGSARSGTSLLSEILGAGEELDNYGEPPEASKSILGISIFDRRFLGLTSIDAIREELLESRHSFLRTERTYVEKWPGNAFLIGELHSVFPNSRFIHIIRDGRAVADSAFRRYGGEWLTGHLNVFTNFAMNQSGYDSSLPMMARGGLRWSLQVQSAIDSLEKLPVDSVHSLRYEDLQSKPDSTIADVFRFLDLEYDTAKVPRIVGHDRRPWEKWSLDYREAFKKVAGQLLDRLGYANDDEW